MAVHIVDIKEVALHIHDISLKRRLIEIGETIVNGAFKADNELAATEQIEQAEHDLFTLTTAGEINRGFSAILNPLKEALGMTENAMKRTKHVVGITTGFIDMDNMLGGLNKSDLLILAARPSMGKTALAVNIAYNAALELKDEEGDNKGCVGLFSLEMSSVQLSARILSMGTRH